MSSKLEHMLLKKERKKRNLENDLIAFTSYFFKCRKERFIENYHHREIANALQKVEDGEIQNLVINIPPRYGKTELAVINWIARCLAKNPKAKFIHLSYSSDLALDNSQKAKELVESEEFQDFWEVSLKGDSKSKKKWYTEEGGGVYATAAGGQVTGFGAGIIDDQNDDLFYGAIIIDDPIKPDSVTSELQLKQVNDRLNNTIKSRRNGSNTPIVIIMQRLHESDMTGFVLDGGMGEHFHHLCLPAIDDDGNALWELKHSLDDLRQQEKADKMVFASQMMQRPAPIEGNIVKEAWFILKDDMPISFDCVVVSVDTAIKANAGCDFTSFTVWGCRKEGYYLIDVINKKLEYPALKKETIRVCDKYNPIKLLVEDKGSGQSLIQDLKDSTKINIVPIMPVIDKVARLSAASATIEAGNVILPLNAMWTDDYIFQMKTFPNAKHDDMVDSTSQFIRWADKNIKRYMKSGKTATSINSVSRGGTFCG